MKPVVLTCGEPAGIGPEIAARAWASLSDRVPMLWLGDPRHLPAGTPFQIIATPKRPPASAHLHCPYWPMLLQARQLLASLTLQMRRVSSQ